MIEVYIDYFGDLSIRGRPVLVVLPCSRTRLRRFGIKTEAYYRLSFTPQEGAIKALKLPHWDDKEAFYFLDFKHRVNLCPSGLVTVFGSVPKEFYIKEIS